MPEPRTHHFIPRFQLEYFADPNGVFQYDLVEDKQKPVGVSVLAAENYLYTIGRGTKNDTTVEKFLADIEGQVAPLFERIDRLDFKFNNNERSLLSFFVALQSQRTPNNRERTKQAVAQMAKKAMKISALSEERFAQTWEKVKKKYPEVKNANDEDMKKSREMFLKEDYDLEVPPEYFIRFMIENLGEFAQRVHQTGWFFITAPSGSQFITSDDPFVMFYPRDENTPFGIGPGLAVQGTEITLPLTPRVCLLMIPGVQGVKKLRVDKKVVRQINKRTAISCRRFLYGKNTALLRNLSSQLRLHQRGIRKKLVHINGGF